MTEEKKHRHIFQDRLTPYDEGLDDYGPMDGFEYPREYEMVLRIKRKAGVDWNRAKAIATLQGVTYDHSAYNGNYYCFYRQVA